MRIAERIVVLIGLILIFAMVIYPPWTITGSHRQHLHEYRWLTDPHDLPEGPNSQVDFSRVLLQGLLVCLAVAIIISTQRIKSGYASRIASARGHGIESAHAKLERAFISVGSNRRGLVVVFWLSWIAYWVPYFHWRWANSPGATFGRLITDTQERRAGATTTVPSSFVPDPPPGAKDPLDAPVDSIGSQPPPKKPVQAPASFIPDPTAPQPAKPSTALPSYEESEVEFAAHRSAPVVGAPPSKHSGGDGLEQNKPGTAKFVAHAPESQRPASTLIPESFWDSIPAEGSAPFSTRFKRALMASMRKSDPPGLEFLSGLMAPALIYFGVMRILRWTMKGFGH